MTSGAAGPLDVQGAAGTETCVQISEQQVFQPLLVRVVERGLAGLLE